MVSQTWQDVQKVGVFCVTRQPLLPQTSHSPVTAITNGCDCFQPPAEPGEQFCQLVTLRHFSTEESVQGEGAAPRPSLTGPGKPQNSFCLLLLPFLTRYYSNHFWVLNGQNKQCGKDIIGRTTLE